MIAKHKSSLSKMAPRFRTDSRHYHVLEELSAGDLFVGFLSSAGNSRRMYEVARVRAREKYANKLALLRLKECGYVKQSYKNSELSFFITKEGKQALRQLYTHATHQNAWDGKWRVVSYDFPESERSARNSLRYMLSKAHFLQVQKSVWISPYDSSILSSLLEKHTFIHKYTIFMTVEKLLPDTAHKKHFNLK